MTRVFITNQTDWQIIHECDMPEAPVVDDALQLNVDSKWTKYRVVRREWIVSTTEPVVWCRVFVDLDVR